MRPAAALIIEFLRSSRERSERLCHGAPPGDGIYSLLSLSPRLVASFFTSFRSGALGGEQSALRGPMPNKRSPAKLKAKRSAFEQLPPATSGCMVSGWRRMISG